MGFSADSLDRLLKVADPIERPVVGALCFVAKETESDGMGGMIVKPLPTIFTWNGEGFYFEQNYQNDQLVNVDATGSAFILIHRTVFEKVHEKYGENWYSHVTLPPNNNSLGEDISFCLKLKELSIPIFVDTGIKTTHLKNIWLDEKIFNQTNT